MAPATLKSPAKVRHPPLVGCQVASPSPHPPSLVRPSSRASSRSQAATAPTRRPRCRSRGDLRFASAYSSRGPNVLALSKTPYFTLLFPSETLGNIDHKDLWKENQLCWEFRRGKRLTRVFVCSESAVEVTQLYFLRSPLLPPSFTQADENKH